MTIRSAIAEWLDPETVREAQRYRWLMSEVHEGYRWLGEFDQIVWFIEWLIQYNHDSWRGAGDAPMKRWPWYGGIPEFREQLRSKAKASAEAEKEAAIEVTARRGEMVPDILRRDGWAVAVHNDYKLRGEPHTFWLFTHPSGRWVKGEGPTDADAIAQCVEAASPAQAA
jgi:hypothetical protein